MLVAFLMASVVFGLLGSIGWNSTGGLNFCIKVAFFMYTIFATALLLGVLVPIFSSPAVRLF